MSELHFAKLLVIDSQNNVLVLRRSGTHPFRPYMPDIPGGNIEAGETNIQAAVRELFEETGITVSENQIVDPHEGYKQTFGSKIVYHSVLVLHLSQVKPNVTISWEHDQFEWVQLVDVQGLETFIQSAVDDIVKNDLWKHTTSS
jgi:8-oxo-dGTP pyrophosphatase MutT (NUDIX family)